MGYYVVNLIIVNVDFILLSLPQMLHSGCLLDQLPLRMVCCSTGHIHLTSSPVQSST